MTIFLIVWFVCGVLGSILLAHLLEKKPLTWGILLLLVVMTVCGFILLFASIFCYICIKYNDILWDFLNKPVFSKNKEKK